MKEILTQPLLSYFRRMSFRGKYRLFYPLLKLMYRNNDYLVSLHDIKTKTLINCSFRSYMESMVAINGFWEHQESLLINKFINEGDYVIDIGANVGIHTLRIAKNTGSKGKVLAIEPNTEVYERLKNNIYLNNLENIVIPANVACGPHSKRILNVNLENDYNRNATLIEDFNSSSAVKKVACSVIPFDEIAKHHLGDKKVNFIKIDIEGFEMEALKSGINLICDSKPIILSEYSEYYSRLQN